jgi:hypothetical protein
LHNFTHSYAWHWTVQRGMYHGTYWTGSWVNTSAGFNAVEKRGNIFAPAKSQTFDSSAARLTACLRGGIHNIPDWCRHLHSSCGSTNNLFQQAKLWFPGSTATFGGDCVKTCAYVARHLARTHPAASPWDRPYAYFRPHPAVSGETINDCHPPPTVLSWFGNLWLLPISKNETEAERTPVWYHWRPNRRQCLTFSQKRTSMKRSKNGGDGGTDVYMKEGTTSRVMAADRPHGEFYDFYSVSPEYLGQTLVYRGWATSERWREYIQEKQCTYNVTLRRIRVIILAEGLDIMHVKHNRCTANCILYGMIFGKKLLIIQSVFWFSLQLLSETLLVLRIRRDTIINQHWSSIKVPNNLVRLQ